jgi:hypothetical protein
VLFSILCRVNIVSDGSSGYWVSVECDFGGGGDMLVHVDSSGAETSTPQLAGFKASDGLVHGKNGKLYIGATDIVLPNAAVLEVPSPAQAFRERRDVGFETATDSGTSSRNPKAETSG